MSNNLNNIVESEINKSIGKFSNDIIVLLTESGEIINVNTEAIKSNGYTEEELLKRNTELIKDNDEKVKMIFNAIENSGNPVLITDTKGNIEYVNKKFELEMGYSKEEILEKGKNILTELLVDDKFDKMVWKTILSNKEWCGEFCSRRKDGSIRQSKASIVTFIDNRDQAKKLILISQDVFDNNHFKEEITQKNMELKNAKKSLNELQGQLEQADKMACIGYLSAGIAHEINNPLGFVSSNFNTLKKYIDKVTEYISEYIKLKNTIEQGETDAISEGIANMNALEAKNKIDFIISDLADLCIDTDEGISRIKNIVLTLKTFVHESNNSIFINYSINKGIEDTLIIVRNEIKYNIEIKTNFFKDIKIIKANPGEINQVLLNIIINASQAIKEKYKKNADFNGMIKITTKSDDEFVYCSIEDNGIGICEENISKIFNPFFTTKPIGVGTGLGLSISYDIIVNKHKGDIKINSALGKGTEFLITLPLNLEIEE